MIRKGVALLLCLSSISWGAMTATCTHVYTNTATNIGAVASGDLIAIGICDTVVSAFVVSDTLNGATYSSFANKNFKAGADTVGMFYKLSSAAGASNTVTISGTGGSDTGWNACIVHLGGATWSVDSSLSSGSSIDGSTAAGTTSIRTNSWSTAGTDDFIMMQFCDESQTQASHTITPAGFTEFQWDNTHVDGTGTWTDATAQTSVQSGWNVATSTNSWGMYVGAFSSGGAAATSKGCGIVGDSIGCGN